MIIKKIIKKNLKKKFNLEKYHKNIAKQKVRGGLKLLFLTLQKLKFNEIKKGFKEEKRIKVVHNSIKKYMQRVVLTQVASQRFIFSNTIRSWKKKIYASENFYKLRKTALKRILQNFNLKQRGLVKYLGKKCGKYKKKIRRVKAKRLCKNWIRLNQFNIFHKLYSKKLKKNKIKPKVNKKKRLQIINSSLSNSSLRIKRCLKKYDDSGSYEDFEDFDLLMSSTGRAKKICKRIFVNFFV
jgi:hypothetical protein